MTAAVVKAKLGTGSPVSWANVEGGLNWNVSDDATSNTPISIPSSTGTNYSWIKNIVLNVNTAGTTSISNRTIAWASAPPTGINIFWKAVAVGSYAQASSSNQPAAAGSNGATPTGYTQVTTTATVYDSTSVSTSSTGTNGKMAVCVLGVDGSYNSGTNGGSPVSLPALTLAYTEA